MNISPIFAYTTNNTNSRRKTFASYPQNIVSAGVQSNPSSPAFGMFRINRIQELYALTKPSSSEKAQQFVARLTQNPRESQQKVRTLLEQYGLDTKRGLNNFFDWSLSPDGYYGAYEDFVKNLFTNANSIDELLKFQPNWAPWKLEEKAFRLSHPQYNNESVEAKAALSRKHQYVREIPFRIGELPEIFPSPQSYENLISALKTSDIKRQTINIDGVDYYLQRLKGGEHNDKFIYLLESNGKKFILKFDRINVEDYTTFDHRPASLFERRTIRKNKYLAADSIYSNACISKYLESNGCDEVPKLLYYDHKTHSAIFEHIEDINGDVFQQGDVEETRFNLNQVNSSYKELNSLGIYMNDASIINEFKTKNGRRVLIDLGHCSFIDQLKPGIKGYNIAFSNIAGPNIGASLAAMLRVILGK